MKVKLFGIEYSITNYFKYHFRFQVMDALDNILHPIANYKWRKERDELWNELEEWED